MATQIVMDHTGDTRHQFDSADGAVAEAERRFRELTGSGFTAAKRIDDGRSEVVQPQRRKWLAPTHLRRTAYARGSAVERRRSASLSMSMLMFEES
jgi:hypothetical protein